MKTRLGPVHYGFLALMTLAIGACHPDRATAPNDRPPRPNGPAADIASLTSAPILFNKPSLNTDLGPSFILLAPDTTVLLADDFVVPAGAVWTLTAVALSGELHETSLSLSIRSDAGGFPGASLPNAAATISPTATSPNACGCHWANVPQLAPITDYLFPLPTALTLPAGTYWLAIKVVAPGSSGPTVFSWQSHGLMGAGLAQSHNEGDTWSTVGAFDASFAIFGTSTQTITLSPVSPNPAPLGSAATVTATAASGLPVALAAGPANVCTLSGTTLSFGGVGTCTVTADQAGNAAYHPAPQVTQDIVVTKGSQTITFPAITPNPATIGGSATLAATASSGLAVSYTSQTGGVCTVSGNTVSFNAVGTCTVAADQAGNASYEAAAQVTQSVTVNNAVQAITFTSSPPASPTVGGMYAVAATGGASGNPVTFGTSTPNVCTVAGSAVSFVIGGVCTVTANQAGNASYLAAPQVTQTFTVNKAAQAIAWTSTPPSPAYLNATYTVGGTGGASGNAVVITVGPSTVCTLNGNVVRFVGAGTCVIAANQGGNNAYAAAAQVTQSVKVDYRYTGFFDPVTNGVLNGAKAGQVIPLKWRLTDVSGAPVTTLSTAGITAKDLACGMAGTEDQVEEYASGSSGLQNLGDGYYQLNWKAPASYAKSCKTLQLDLGEGGGPRTARFAFSK